MGEVPGFVRHNQEEEAGMIVFLIIGVLAGCIAGKLMQDSGFDLGVDLFAGIAGSFIGGYLFRFLVVTVDGTNDEMIMAALAAVVILFITGLYQKLPFQLRSCEVCTEIADNEFRTNK